MCALYIPEVRFASVTTMEPIILKYVPTDRHVKVLQYVDIIGHCLVAFRKCAVPKYAFL